VGGREVPSRRQLWLGHPTGEFGGKIERMELGSNQIDVLLQDTWDYGIGEE
jgi:hypothetical protein